jgi:hypothetical protein
VCQVPPTFTIGGNSEFRAYNVLLSNADPITECTEPNLALVPGSKIFPFPDITSQCVKAGPPDVSGTLTFTNTGGTNWNVDGVLDLAFVIEASIAAFSAEVTIMTSSSTPLSGTGMGTVSDGGTITMDALNPDYNVQAGIPCSCEPIADEPQPCGPGQGGECPGDDQLCVKPFPSFIGGCQTGTVICEAVNNTGVGNACTCADGMVCADCPNDALGQTCTDSTCDPVDVSVAICPLANGLKGGLNLTPLPGDPLQRAWPDITFSGAPKLNMQMDGGPSLPGGWYVNNPPFLSGDGTQFLALTGVEQ